MSRDTQLVIGPNASMTVAHAWLFMGLATAVAVCICVVMVVHGLWPVLPFAGLEIGALGLALYVSVRRNGYREVIRFAEDEVRIEFGTLGRGAGGCVSLQRAWTRVRLEPGRHPHAPTELSVCSGGRQVVIGRCLTDEERERLFGRLRELLSPAWRRMPGAQAEQPAPELPFGER